LRPRQDSNLQPRD